MSSLLKRWWWALLIVAVGIGAWRLRFDVDILNLLPPEEPTVQGLKLYERHFTNARELVVTLRAPDAERAEKLASSLADRLRQQTNLVESVSWQPPWMEDPAKMAELLACLWLNQPPADFGALTNRLAPGNLPSVLADTKEALTTSMSPMDMARRAFDPFDLLNMPSLNKLDAFSMEQGQQMFASQNGSFRLVFVQSAVDLGSYRSCASWLKSIEAAVAGLKAEQPAEWDGVVVRYTGRPVFVNEIATSMQNDMRGSVVGTSLVIALLFWLTHRRWLPMLWLLTLLALILFATLALGGLVLGTISVVSMGFAAVLLGLAVDYAVVHYQEALAHPNLSVPEIRRAIAPSILWAAITTITAFLVLNFGGLPGLGQLGTLVGLGVALAALVMVMIYLPPLFPNRRQAPAAQAPASWWSYFVPPQESLPATCGAARGSYHRAAIAVTVLILAVGVAVLCLCRPALDGSGDALRPQHGEAETALAEITAEMGLPPEPLWLIVSGARETDVYRRLAFAEEMLNRAMSNRVIGRYLLPTALWPRAEFQAANRATAAALAEKGPRLRAAALKEGFNTNALVLTDELLRTWTRAGTATNVVWPTNNVSQWLLKRFVAHPPDQWLVMGLIYPATNQVEAASLAELSTRLAQDQAYLSGWQLLGAMTLQRVKSKMWRVVTPMVILVLASLWFAFRRSTEILLGSAVLLLSGLVLLTVMALAGWSWNLLNMMAVPLILGTGVDYSIFMQMALRRHGGDLALVRRSIGRALLLCGGTAIAGFSSLAWSSNPGMASLGKVCAVGIGANMMIGVFLLPAWWIWIRRRAEFGNSTNAASAANAASQFPDRSAAETTVPRSRKPSYSSSFYRAGLWHFGLAIVRILPVGLVKGFCLIVAEIYCRRQRERREMVVANFLPVLGGDRDAAEKAARRLFRKFSAKLVDLWRVEGGVPVTAWLTHSPELEIIHAARARARGVLFITLHLGNWEHGGLLLNQLGIPLTVLTLAEPDDGLTDLRITLRRRCGVETLIIGQDSFAFVEVIKRLQTGAALAISLDRPAARGGVPIEFFGRKFDAPAAAAELARAAGCALVGVTLVRRPGGYAVKVLPEFAYDRRALGSREARQALTQKILRAFEPEIRKDIDQWYQFVPLWR